MANAGGARYFQGRSYATLEDMLAAVTAAGKDPTAWQTSHPAALRAYGATPAAAAPGAASTTAPAAAGAEAPAAAAAPATSTGSGYVNPLAGGGGAAPVRTLFNQMGGKKGTQMSFPQFKKWYQQQSQAAGGDLGSYLGMSGLTAGRTGNKASFGAGANVFTAGSNVRDFMNPNTLSDAGELYWLNRQLGSQYATLDEAKNALALPSGVAGVSQWNQNVGGGGGPNLPDYLTNVSGEDIRYDPQAYNLMFGAMSGLTPQQAQARLKAQQALVQPWMAKVDAALQAQQDINREGQTGIPFGFELMKGANLNQEGGANPLWEGGAPSSLLQMGANQAGEGDFLKSLSMEELMSKIWPLYQAQFHRQPGQEAPFEAGLTFGSPVLQTSNANGPGGNYIRSPMMGYGGIGHGYTPDPQQIQLEGYAGREVPESELYANLGGGYYNRFQSQSQLQALPDWNKQRAAMGAPPETEADFWSYGPYNPFQDLQTSDPETYARIMAILGGPQGSGSVMA